ncbi:hypothetical protein [Mucilaginibacter sp.]
MTIKPISHQTSTFFTLFFCALTIFTSCKKGQQITPSNAVLKVSGADYVWGDLSINRTTGSDAIKYNANGNLDSVVSYDANGHRTGSIILTYSGNKITLNTVYDDTYELDAAGRVINHSSQQIQNGYNFISTENFTYDANGYLNKVTMAENANLLGVSSGTTIYSVINYEVQNGNYIKFTLSNTIGDTVTRQYNFTYNSSVKINGSYALFAPTFSNNTTSNIDKYLNYGKTSVNLLTGINYTIVNLDNSVSTGLFNVVTKLNDANYLTQLSLTGNDSAGFPSDNISPLPRSIKFSY